MAMQKQRAPMPTDSHPPTNRQGLGRWGESLAAERLQADGYEILARNWRCAQGEIDLVARDEDMLIMVEVKTRRSKAYGYPEEALTPRKAQKLIDLGVAYVAELEDPEIPWRIDLIAIQIDNSGKLQRYEHIPDAVRGW